ncbi:hypothetical protein C6499_09525 [Candidatus Poribacteria bacterium]|nr:MAG: hypothetical protein C6499_09525 [Candidatus Poribacteria bacterium]
MTLKEHIDDIREGLKTNRYPNEAAVSQGIVLRLLGALDWPTYDTQIVIPEYGVEGTRVDFALCHPSSKPRVFIEAKQVGNIKGAEEQLFGYDSRVRVPIAVLTDGREWQFFHPTGEGTWAERKVCELDIITRDSGENAEKLNRYLNYESIRTGETVEAIKADYEEVVQQRQVATRLPEAWNKLLEEADEFLLHAIAEKTEDLCDYRPTDEQVLAFLKSLEIRKISPESTHPPTISPAQPTLRREPRTRNARQTRLRVTMPNGTVIEHPKAIDTWIEVILELGPDRVLEVGEGQIISTSPNFRDGRPEEQHGQYYIAKDYSTKDKKRLLDRIADSLGVPLKIEIVDK